MIPSVASMLLELYPNKSARDYLPLISIIYMGPGGHRTVAYVHLGTSGPLVLVGATDSTIGLV